MLMSKSDGLVLQPIGTEVCFYCDQQVKDRVVTWHGSFCDGGYCTIMFHPACAEQFARRFMRDLWEADIRKWL